MIVTINCANANCKHEIGRSDVEPARLERYPYNVRHQRLSCVKCTRTGRPIIKVLENGAPPAPEPTPAPAPEPTPDPVVPDTLPDDIAIDPDIHVEEPTPDDDPDLHEA